MLSTVEIILNAIWRETSVTGGTQYECINSSYK